MIVGDDGKALWRIHGVDYDLHSFVESHPGGALAIRLGEGTECTQLFESYHVSSSPAFRVLEKHRVTDPRSTMEPMPTISAFKADLDLMVRAHFASGSGRPRSHRATWSHWLLCAFFFGAELVCWYNWMLNGSWLAAFLLPVFFWLMAVNVSHDASHFAFARRPWVNEARDSPVRAEAPPLRARSARAASLRRRLVMRPMSLRHAPSREDWWDTNLARNAAVRLSEGFTENVHTRPLLSRYYIATPERDGLRIRLCAP